MEAHDAEIRSLMKNSMPFILSTWARGCRSAAFMGRLLPLLLPLLLIGPLHSQDGGEDGRRMSREEAYGRFSEQLDTRRVKSPYEKGHRNSLAEFEAVVQRARLSTVKVMKGDHVKAFGTVVAPEGLIVTKASEIEDDHELSVELPNEERKVAELIEVNEENDLALLWVHDFELTPVSWASGANLPVGSLVVAAGTFSLPVAIGTVSLPLRNLMEASKGFLGVAMEPTEDGIGLNVREVVRDSGAEAAGIEPGDLILAIDGEEMWNSQDLINTIANAEPGDVVVVQLRRRDDELILEVTLGDRDSGTGYDMPKHEMLDNTARMGGRVSRKRSGYKAAIQHDMLLRVNQCGGPLVNLDGDVVGINIARASRVKSYTIPSDVILNWLGDPRDLAREVLVGRVKNAGLARRAAEEALDGARAVESEVRSVLEELEARRQAEDRARAEGPIETPAAGSDLGDEENRS